VTRCFAGGAADAVAAGVIFAVGVLIALRVFIAVGVIIALGVIVAAMVIVAAGVIVATGVMIAVGVIIAVGVGASRLDVRAEQATRLVQPTTTSHSWARKRFMATASPRSDTSMTQ
jgi:hypothetical protein